MRARLWGGLVVAWVVDGAYLLREGLALEAERRTETYTRRRT